MDPRITGTRLPRVASIACSKAARVTAGLGAELRCGLAARRLLLGPYTWSSVFQFEGTAPAGPGTG
jgi:hypothetical protein